MHVLPNLYNTTISVGSQIAQVNVRFGVCQPIDREGPSRCVPPSLTMGHLKCPDLKQKHKLHWVWSPIVSHRWHKPPFWNKLTQLSTQHMRQRQWPKYYSGCVVLFFKIVHNLLMAGFNKLKIYSISKHNNA